MYKKGKDIKVPFDCLWHYYTRKFEGTIKWNDSSHYQTKPPEGFKKW